ncbi:MAG: hypothetical protein R6T97_12440, partial [Yoonia sp.]
MSGGKHAVKDSIEFVAVLAMGVPPVIHPHQSFRAPPLNTADRGIEKGVVSGDVNFVISFLNVFQDGSVFVLALAQGFFHFVLLIYQP